VGDLDLDTVVEQVEDNRFKATLSQDWEIWGPQGGYVASVAMRAAGVNSPFERPASFFCQFLGVAKFDEVTLEVTTLRSARTAHAQRVEMTQDGKPILEATIWSIGEVEGLEHDVTEPPDVPGPSELPSIVDLLSEEELASGPPFRFWENFDNKPLRFRKDWPPPEPLEPVYRNWIKFEPTPRFDDPWIDACRSLILVDVQSWPSASPQHAYKQAPFIAPSLDLYVAFHEVPSASEWLLTDGHGPVAADGLMAWNGRLWSESGALVASGAGQMLCRRVQPPG
jgi:acyl-CoA thioesterase-2